MRTMAASLPSRFDGDNEDWYSVSPHSLVVLDGATARTNTGCVHGISWYAANLGEALIEGTRDSSSSLPAILATGIARVAALHPNCDLTHSGTPSAAVGMVRIRAGIFDYLVLGDVSIVLDGSAGVVSVSDDRVSQTAERERRIADSFPIGSAEKNSAMVQMKHAELAMRNRDGGYWIAAADPSAAEHSLSGQSDVRTLRRFAVLTDGAARIVSPFGEMSWSGLLDAAESDGPEAVLQRVRQVEASDPIGLRWPRNKQSDDATLIIALDVELGASAASSH